MLIEQLLLDPLFISILIANKQLNSLHEWQKHAKHSTRGVIAWNQTHNSLKLQIKYHMVQNNI
jgi:hypothetical protein